MKIMLTDHEDYTEILFSGTFTFFECEQVKYDLSHLEIPNTSKLILNLESIENADISFFQLMYAFVNEKMGQQPVAFADLTNNKGLIKIEKLLGIDVSTWDSQ